MLEEANLKVGSVTSTESATEKKDHVISTSPEGGYSVPPGSTVALTVSNGMVEVPDLTGEHIEDAQEILKELKLQSRAEAIETDEQKPEHVVDQSARGLDEQDRQSVV